PARRVADLTSHGVGPFLDRRLLRARRGPGLAAAERFRYPLLALGERSGLGERTIERRERLPAPFSREGIAPAAQRFRHAGEPVLGFAPGLFRRGGLTEVGGLRGALHRRAGIAGRLPRLGECAGLRGGGAEVGRDALDPR